MSYYSILPSQRVGTNNSTGQNAQNPDPMRPKQLPQGGFRTRDVDPNELSSNQMNDILDENGAYVQRARAAGLAQANSRGLLNSSMAAGAAHGAAIDAAMPMAQQQAGAYTNVGDRNMAAENDYLLAQGGWNNALALDRNRSNTSLQIAGMDNDERRRQFDTSFDENARRYDTDWDREQQATATANQNARNNYIASGMINMITADPSIWRDGEGAMGLANYYASNFSSLWDNLFNPSPANAAP
jgi:hypothetical protein